jgi:predicted transcriptional regulator
MDKEKKRTKLRKAVDWLISEGKIKQDKDLQEIFKLSKSTISEYINGKPGKNFITEFDKKSTDIYYHLKDKMVDEAADRLNAL